MRLAVLSADQDALSLMSSAAASGRHCIVVSCDSESWSRQIRVLCPGVAVETDWAALLNRSDLDAVVVGTAGDPSQRIQQLRILCQSGMSLIMVHPGCDMLLGFELQMIQRDSGAVIVPFFPEMQDSAWEEARRYLAGEATGALGNLQQLVLERHLPATATPRDLQRQFARDACGLRRLLGPMGRLGALAAAPYPAELWANTSIHMTSRSGLIVRWSVDSTSGEPHGQLTLVGQNQRLTFPLSDGPGSPGPPPQPSSATVPEAAWPRAAGDPAALLDHLQAVVEQRADRARCDRMWDDACRALELQETAEASHRRGKTLELYDEEHTEEETFKSVMAAGGCLALLVTLALFPLASMLHALDLGIFDHPVWERGVLRWLAPRNWPVLLVSLLLVFLGLQGLQLLFSKSPRRARPTPSDGPRS